MVNQLPASNLMPFNVPDWVVLLFAFVAFIALTVLDQAVNSNQLKDQVKLLQEAVSIVLVSFLSSTCIFIFSTDSSTPEGFRRACQYTAFSIFILGIVLAVVKILFFVKENPEESQDVLEQSFLQAQSIVQRTNQIITEPTIQLLPSELLKTYLRKNIEQQEYLRGRITELKNRFRYRNEALAYLEKLIKQKSLSREISESIFSFCAPDISSSLEAGKMKEKFRSQINFILKILSISVKYGRANALEKAFALPLFRYELKIDKSIYHTAFQLAKQRVGETAIQNGLSAGAIIQIEHRFDDLIKLIESADLPIS